MILGYSYIIIVSCLVTEGTTIEVKFRGDGKDLCGRMAKFAKENMILNIRYMVFDKLIWDALTIMPLTIFLVFYKPHDCFRCFGKNPDQVFSIF